MITIGQLARYVGVTTKTIRFYHRKGLLAEPDRDASGYRRYTAQHVVEMIRIRTLAEAGVPLAVIRELTGNSDPDEFNARLDRIDEELTVRIRRLRATQRRLRQLAAGEVRLLPPEVDEHLERLPGLGFSPRWVRLQTDLWILIFVTHPELAVELFRDQAQAVDDLELRRLYLRYDEAYDLDPQDSRIDDLAQSIVDATITRYADTGPPGQGAEPEIPRLIQGTVNDLSPAWQRIDQLVRSRLTHL